ncbi:MAG TPA: hypothetical protein VOA41_07995 [Candidatus Dormibacteraeota bacterium]|nr:hypothetical protein [Candidatus Dormibacteraeota bacterium]
MIGWLVLGVLATTSLGFALTPQTDAALARLKPATIQAFQQYVQLTDAQHSPELLHSPAFLWVDALPDVERARAIAELASGSVKIKRLETRDDGHAILCPHGLIHHWVGVIFVPGARLEDILRVLQDYDHHAKYYTPDVQRSKLLARNGDDFRVFLRFRRKKVVTVILNTEHQIHYTRLDLARATSRSSATRIAEVQAPDKRDEREKAPGDDGGYLWRMETWWRIIERDGGTYVQCESASLTRDIPAGLGWLVGPFVNSIPRESLTFTLEATRRQLTEAGSNRH